MQTTCSLTYLAVTSGGALIFHRPISVVERCTYSPSQSLTTARPCSNLYHENAAKGVDKMTDGCFWIKPISNEVKAEQSAGYILYRFISSILELP